MNSIIQQLRTGDQPPPLEIADYIEGLEKRIRDQHATMDKAASIMLEGVVSEDGIDSEQADACIDQIRGMFAEVGKTTVEHYQGLIYAKVAQIAGLSEHDEFDIMAELDKIGGGLAASAAHAARSAWAASVLWEEQANPRLHVSVGCGCCGSRVPFPAGATWEQAVDQVISKR